MPIKKSVNPKKPTLKEIMTTEKQTPRPAAVLASMTESEPLVQLNIRIPAGLHSKARIKALEDRVLLKDVVAQFLTTWVKEQ